MAACLDHRMWHSLSSPFWIIWFTFEPPGVADEFTQGSYLKRLGVPPHSLDLRSHHLSSAIAWRAGAQFRLSAWRNFKKESHLTMALPSCPSIHFSVSVSTNLLHRSILFVVMYIFIHYEVAYFVSDLHRWYRCRYFSSQEKSKILYHIYSIF